MTWSIELIWAIEAVLFVLGIVGIFLMRRWLAAKQAELASHRETMKHASLILPVCTFDRECHLTSIELLLPPIPAEGEVRFRTLIMRGLGKMTMDGPNERGDRVRLLVDFEAGLITRATDAGGGQSGVPEAFHQAFDV